MPKTNNGAKKDRTFRSQEQVAFDHGRQLMAYAVRCGRWAWVESLTPILKALAPSDQVDAQRTLPIDKP
jgi:hypothetical protein